MKYILLLLLLPVITLAQNDSCTRCWPKIVTSKHSLSPQALYDMNARIELLEYTTDSIMGLLDKYAKVLLLAAKVAKQQSFIIEVLKARITVLESTTLRGNDIDPGFYNPISPDHWNGETPLTHDSVWVDTVYSFKDVSPTPKKKKHKKTVITDNGFLNIKTYIMTTGEKLVRTAFNPAKDSVVDQIKQKTAELIDLAESLKDKDARLSALAITAYEQASMWAVKAATA